MSRIVLTSNNRLAVDGHCLCGHTPAAGSVVEVFKVTVGDLLGRINGVVRPVARSPGRKKVTHDKDFVKRLKVLMEEQNDGK
jgi:hypothetical protein